MTSQQTIIKRKNSNKNMLASGSVFNLDNRRKDSSSGQSEKFENVNNIFLDNF